MRSRLTILLFLVAFTLYPRPASAGVWDAFVTWLSELDPKSGGVIGGMSENVHTRSTLQTHSCANQVSISGQTGVLGGSADGNAVTVVPYYFVVEAHCTGGFEIGGGFGALSVFGAPVGHSLTKPIAVAQITASLGGNWALRGGAMFTLQGFDAGDFGPASTGGRDTILMLGVGYKFK